MRARNKRFRWRRLASCCTSLPPSTRRGYPPRMAPSAHRQLAGGANVARSARRPRLPALQRSSRSRLTRVGYLANAESGCGLASPRGWAPMDTQASSLAEPPLRITVDSIAQGLRPSASPITVVGSNH